MLTFWLYLGTEIITSVRAPAGTSPATVRQLAIERNNVQPIGYKWHAPYQVAAMLQRARVTV